MTDFSDSDYDVYDIDISELRQLRTVDDIAPGVTQHNTASENRALDIISGAGDNRVQIWGHDSETNLMIPFVTNEGHSPGMTASYLLDQMVEGGYDTLSDYLSSISPIGEVGKIDFFQINEYGS